jgi:pimeloyl-ACP methyl ester carboxylesterase
MGGMMVLRFAVDYPGMLRSRVAGAVLTSTLASTQGRLQWWHAFATATAPAASRALRLAGRLPGGHLPSTDLSYLVARVGLGARPSPTHVELTRAMTGATPVSIVAELWVDIERFDVRRALRDETLPAVVVVGTRDNITPMVNAEVIVRNLPGSTLVRLPGAGHMPMLERRHAFNDVVSAFVDSLP